MEITGKELKTKIESGESVIIDFWAGFCGPCKVYKPIFEKVAESSSIQMYTMDVEKNSEFSIELGIRAVPTTKLFTNGVEKFSKSGIVSEMELKSVINNVING